MSQILLAKLALIDFINTTLQKPQEVYNICLAQIEPGRNMELVCEILKNSNHHVTIKLGREAETSDVVLLSRLLLTSGTNLADSVNLDMSNFCKPKFFKILGLDLSNSGLIDNHATILSAGLSLEFECRPCVSKLVISSTLESLDLSGNDMTYTGLGTIMQALSAGSRAMKGEFSYSGNAFFIDGHGGLKPLHSIPIRFLKISSIKDLGLKGKEDFFGSLCGFISKNWTLVNLDISELDACDWVKEDWQKLHEFVLANASRDVPLQSKIKVLSLPNNSSIPVELKFFNDTLALAPYIGPCSDVYEVEPSISSVNQGHGLHDKLMGNDDIVFTEV